MVVPFSPQSIPKALTIAGSDSGGGAGIQADLKTFAALGVYGTSAITAVTAQNTRMVLAIAEVPEDAVALQIDGVLEDIGAGAIKTGMLSGASIIDAVADRLEAWGIENLVVDPVMISKTGDALLQANAVRSLVTKLLPLALIVTPNLHEAEVLSKRQITTDDDVKSAANAIHALGPRYVVIKGGHRDGPPTDLVFDGQHYVEFSADRVETTNTHGTGCTFSAAIAAYLALGLGPLESIRLAKEYLTGALRASYSIGAGHSPVNHFHNVRGREPIAPNTERRV